MVMVKREIHSTYTHTRGLKCTHTNKRKKMGVNTRARTHPPTHAYFDLWQKYVKCKHKAHIKLELLTPGLFFYQEKRARTHNLEVGQPNTLIIDCLSPGCRTSHKPHITLTCLHQDISFHLVLLFQKWWLFFSLLIFFYHICVGL